MKLQALSFDEALSDLLQNEENSTLKDAARYALLSPGKRLRPKLLIATIESLNGDQDLGINPALAIECIHSYSLIHDDLPCMDNDDFRRGLPTTHKKFGEATALLAGDLLLTHAFNLISTAESLPPQTKVDLISLLSSRAGIKGMIGGQFLDISTEGKKLSLDDLEKIHKRKTGDLISTAIEMGAIIANATYQQLVTLRQIGYDIGLAFQIIDDVLDVTKSFEKHGKTVSTDQTLNKTTYVTLLGVDGAKAKAHAIYNVALQNLDDLKLPSNELKNTLLALDF